MADAIRDAQGNASLVSDRLTGQIDPGQLAELKALEKLALGRSVQIAANGRHPKDWTFERWVAVGTTITLISGWLFFAGGEWKGVKSDIDAVRADMAGVMDGIKRDRIETQQKLDALRVEMERIERADEYYRQNGRRPTTFRNEDAR
jgi:hypothetical protein